MDITHDGELENFSKPKKNSKDFFGRHYKYCSSNLDIFYDYYNQHKDYNFFINASKNDIYKVIDDLRYFDGYEENDYFYRRVSTMTFSLDMFFRAGKTIKDPFSFGLIIEFFVKYKTPLFADCLIYRALESLEIIPEEYRDPFYKEAYFKLGKQEAIQVSPSYKKYLLRENNYTYFSSLLFENKELKQLLKLLKCRRIRPTNVSIKRWASQKPTIKQWQRIIDFNLPSLEDDFPKGDMPHNLIKAILKSEYAHQIRILFECTNISIIKRTLKHPLLLIKAIKRIKSALPSDIQRESYDNNTLSFFHYLATSSALLDKIIYNKLCKIEPLMAYYGFLYDCFEPTKKNKLLYQKLFFSGRVNMKQLSSVKGFENFTNNIK